MQATIQQDQKNIESLRSQYPTEIINAYLFSAKVQENNDLKKFTGFFNEFKMLYIHFSPEQDTLDITVLLSVVTDIDQALPGLSQHYQKVTNTLANIQGIPSKNKALQISKSQGILKQIKSSIEKMLSDYLLCRLNMLSAIKLAKKEYCELKDQPHPLELLSMLTQSKIDKDNQQHLPAIILKILTRYCQEQENKAQAIAQKDLGAALEILQIEREIVNDYTNKNSHQFELLNCITQHKAKRLDKIENTFRAA